LFNFQGPLFFAAPFLERLIIIPQPSYHVNTFFKKIKLFLISFY